MIDIGRPHASRLRLALVFWALNLAVCAGLLLFAAR